MSIKLIDVADVLFAEFKTLNNKNLTGQALADQLERTKAVISVSKQIVEVGKLGLEAMKVKDELFDKKAEIPDILSLEHDK